MAAIVLGVALMMAGYARTRPARRTAAAPPGPAAFEPIYAGAADIRDEIALPVRSPAGLRYESAEILVRNGIDLVGVVQVPEHRMGQRVAVTDLAGGIDPPPRPAAVPLVVGISVVVPTFGRPERAAECVRSILATDWPALEVLVVDNKPGDAECASALRRLAAEYDQVRYVPATERGASAARNRGIAMATHEIVALTDDDVVVDRHWPAALAMAFEDLTVACVTGLVRPRRLETRAQMLFERNGGFGKGLAARRYCGDEPSENGGGPLYPYAAGMFGSGNNVAFRRAVLGEVGGYDVRLGPGAPTHAGEDLDIFLRVLQDGYVLLYEPRALVYHDHRTGEDELRRQLYSHGSGVSAMLFGQAVRRASPVGLLRRLPSALRQGRSGPGYPPRLALAKWRGLATGPLLLALAHLRKPASPRPGRRSPRSL
jgi:GT2 family glycosyltransferase